MEIIYKKVNDLIPYINNSRTHSEEQINQICASINEFGFTNPLLIDEKDNIIAGHGRLLASKKLKMEEVPCIILSGLTEAQKKAYVIADNKMALNAGWNEELLKLELENLKELDFDLGLTGFDIDEWEDIFNFSELNEELDNFYTTKIKIPQYEITGEEPDIKDLLDEFKVNELKEEIKNANITDEQKEFLLKATTRLYTFNYSNIAEYYAHQDKEMQKLMEKLALVIIDVKDAIANGYCELSKTLEEMMNDEN